MRIPKGLCVYLAPTLAWRGEQYPNGAHGASEGINIWFDPRSRANLCRTIVHEILHVEHPTWTESKVRRETKKILDKMTWIEQAKLLRKVVTRAKIKDKEDG